MTAASSTSPDAARLVTRTMLVLWLALATVPLWIAQAGLYPYLGVEILIWSIYALAFNLVLGTAGLPSFGHGAYFGVGAYAFGLCQFNLSPNLWVSLAAATIAALVSAVDYARRLNAMLGLKPAAGPADVHDVTPLRAADPDRPRNRISA